MGGSGSEDDDRALADASLGRCAASSPLGAVRGCIGRSGEGRDFRVNKIECFSALGSHPRHVLDSPDAILPECSVSLSVGSVFPSAHFAKSPPTPTWPERECL